MQAPLSREGIDCALVGFAGACELAGLGFDTGAALELLCARAGTLDPEDEGLALVGTSRHALRALLESPRTSCWAGRLCVAKKFEVHSRLAAMSCGAGALLRLVDGALRLSERGVAEAWRLGVRGPSSAAMSRSEAETAARAAASSAALEARDGEAAKGLSAEQRAVLQLARAGASMLLTGAAGTGKSLTVTRLVQAVRRDARRVVVTASTGIAACAVGGVTLHAFSGVGSAQRPEREIVQSALRNPRTVRRWRAADCLVIEEVSMVDADLLSKVDAVARACRGRDAPMGGVQTVLVGDFHQLPPVSRGGPAFAFESPVWPRLVQHTVVLREVFRQRDSAFVRALNAVRAGAVGAADRALLARCAVPADGKAAAPAGAVVLCPRNDEADAINASRLAGLPGRATSLLASFTESKEGSAGERDSLRRQLERGCLAPEQLQLKVGASVVLLTNLDPARGLVNGTRGVVTGWAEGAAAGPSPRVRFFTGSDIPDLAEALARGSALAARAGG